MFVVYEKETQKVVRFTKKMPIHYGSYSVAEYNGEIPKGDYHTFENGKLVGHTIEKTADQIAKEKQMAYEREVERLIRQKYTLSQELAILRQRDTKPQEFAEYNAYAEECKATARGI